MSDTTTPNSPLDGEYKQIREDQAQSRPGNAAGLDGAYEKYVTDKAIEYARMAVSTSASAGYELDTTTALLLVAAFSSGYKQGCEDME